jgi:hypothetical protein
MNNTKPRTGLPTLIAGAALMTLALGWVGKRLDKKLFKLVGKRHRFDTRSGKDRV